MGKICNIHMYFESEDLPVCAWVSRGHTQRLSTEGMNQLFGHLHCLGVRAKEDQKDFDGFIPELPPKAEVQPSVL